MQTAEFDVNSFEHSRQREEDEKLLVKFYMKSVQDKAATAREGRAIFKEIEYIDIKIPGNRDGAARPATFKDKQRFPKHYQAFQQRIDMPTEGTPLSEWPHITRSLADEMAFMNIKTVEQLANLTDNNAARFMGAQMYKQKAKEWLEQAKEDVTIDKLKSELAARDAMLEKLEARVNLLTARLDDVHYDDEHSE